SCSISIRWSVSIAALAFRCARCRPFSRSMTCRKSGTRLPSATQNTTAAKTWFQEEWHPKGTKRTKRGAPSLSRFMRQDGGFDFPNFLSERKGFKFPTLFRKQRERRLGHPGTGHPAALPSPHACRH